MLVLRTLEDLRRRAVALGRASGLAGVLVPTMGGLHEGHAALIRQAAAARLPGDAMGAVVSIFVNPTQFNERADFERYPRTEEADLALCESAGAAVVFAPGLDTVYPPRDTPPVPPLPVVATEPGLEDASRPGHFAGVCQVVLRLLRLLEPRGAVFGEKDWQQLRVVREMTRAQRLPVEIFAAATVRDADGLALSSRNRFLGEEDRLRALAIPRALDKAAGVRKPAEAERVMRQTLTEAGLVPEYAAVRDAESLGPIGPATRAGRALIAARAGKVRLIDNAPWPALAPAPGR